MIGMISGEGLRGRSPSRAKEVISLDLLSMIVKTTKFVVIDSSVAVKWVSSQNESCVDLANKIIQHAQEDKFHILMPELSKYEVANALVYKKLDIELLLISLEDFYHLPIKFVHDNQKLALKTAEIAVLNKITYYDASFIALAIEYKADLITANPKHQSKYSSKDIKVISLEHFK